MSIASDVAAVLRAEPVSRISFSLENISVNKTRMESVARAIESGDVAISLGSAGEQLGAAYSSFVGRRPVAGQKQLIGEIRLSASALQDSVGRAGIFHESCHALLDVVPGKFAVRNADEVFAYLADGLYLKAVHASVSGQQSAMAIYNAAFAIIAAHNMLGQPGVALQLADCQALLAAINANPAYM
jgi:hypothetical protein